MSDLDGRMGNTIEIMAQEFHHKSRSRKKAMDVARF